MSLEKAMITNTVTGEKIPILFNPEEYTINKDNNFSQVAIPGLQAPLLQFVHGNMKTLEMELFLDTYEKHKESNKVLNEANKDVRELTSKITDLMNIDATTHAPPVLIFTWGSLSFRGVLNRVSQRFILFMPNGMPVRARLQVSFNELTNADFEAKEIKRETANFSKLYSVKQGDSLNSIAWRCYGNPGLWRPIAICNHIYDPRNLQIDQRLIIPKLPYIDSSMGEIHYVNGEVKPL